MKTAKRIISNLLMLFFLVILTSQNKSYADSIRNVSLDGLQNGSTAIVGSTVSISWLPSVQSRQDIVLRKDGLPLEVLVSDLHRNVSSFRWKIENIEPDGGYSIMVVSKDNVYGASQQFAITSLASGNLRTRPTSPPVVAPNSMAATLIVTNPREGAIHNVWGYSSTIPQLGTSSPTALTIRWVKTGQQNDKVRILLVSEERKWTGLLEQDTANDGSERIELGNRNLRPGRYVIRVDGRTTDNKPVKGESGQFTIINKSPFSELIENE